MDYDKLYEKLYVDCFHNMILVGQDSCLQVYLTDQDNLLSVAPFTREDYRDKLLRIVCEFNGAYITKTVVHDRGIYWLKHNHGKSQNYEYILKDDPEKTPQPLCSFLDTIGYIGCQSQLMAIVSEYHQVVAEEDGIDLLNEGVWDGYLLSLAQNGSLLFQIHWYAAIGLFIKDGVNYLGLYHPNEGIVGMGSKASKGSYPRVFRVNDGYAYSVFYDSNRKQGVINRVRITLRQPSSLYDR